MNLFHTLPNETLFQIFSDLPSSDLARVCQVSRKLKTAAEVLLYTEAELFGSISPEKSKSSFEIFVDTLQHPERASLASYVQSVNVRWYTTPGRQYLSNWKAEALFDEYRIVYIANIIAALSLLPVLKVLDIDNPHAIRDLTYILRAFDRSLPNAPQTLPAGLQSLEACRLDHSPSLRLSTKSVLAVMQLPRLRSLAVRLAKIEPVTAWAEHPSAFSHVTDLSIEGPVSNAELHAILRAPIALTTFCFVRHMETEDDPARFMCVLDVVRGTMQHLRIRGITGPRRTHEPEPSPQFLGVSLRSWGALQTLDWTLTPLLGIPPEPGNAMSLPDRLPPSLRVLKITGDFLWDSPENVLWQILGLAEQKEESLPVLEEVWIPSYLQTTDMMQRVRTAYEVADVKIKVLGGWEPNVTVRLVRRVV